MKKLFFIATFFATIIGYWLGNADFPQRCLQHALSYPSLAKEVNGAKTFKDTAISHSHTISGGYSGLEKKAFAKMKAQATQPEQWLYIMNFANTDEQKEDAVEMAAVLAQSSRIYDDVFGEVKYEASLGWENPLGWYPILKSGEELGDKTFDFVKTALLISNAKPDVLAAIQYEFKGDQAFSDQLLQKVKDIPVTATTFNDWVTVQGTPEMEDVAIRKMALASTTTADLMRKMPRFLNPSKQEMYALVIISYPSTYEDCFNLYGRLSMNEWVANSWANRCLSLSTSKEQRKQFKLGIKNLPYEVHGYFPHGPWWKSSVKKTALKNKKRGIPDSAVGIPSADYYRGKRNRLNSMSIKSVADKQSDNTLKAYCVLNADGSTTCK